MDAVTAQAIFAGIVILVGFLQLRETRRLAHITTDLQHKVQRLNVELDQRLLRLNRARELCAEVHRLFASELHATLNEKERRANDVSIFVYVSELGGLVDAIGDTKLKSLLDKDLSPILESYTEGTKPIERLEMFSSIVPIFARMYRRLYELPEVITRGETDSRNIPKS